MPRCTTKPQNNKWIKIEKNIQLKPNKLKVENTWFILSIDTVDYLRDAQYKCMTSAERGLWFTCKITGQNKAR